MPVNIMKICSLFVKLFSKISQSKPSVADCCPYLCAAFYDHAIECRLSWFLTLHFSMSLLINNEDFGELYDQKRFDHLECRSGDKPEFKEEALEDLS